MKKLLLHLKEKYFPHIPVSLIIVFLFVIVGLILISIFKVINDNGILVNVAIELIGILVTILIVEYFIRKYEDKKWSKFKELFQRNLRPYLINIFIEFQVTFNLPIEYNNDSCNISRILDHKSQILDKIKQIGLKDVYSFFRGSDEILENLISLAKINPNPDMITVLLNIKSNLSNLSSVSGQKDEAVWNAYGKLIEESIERSFLKVFEDLSYLEKNYLNNVVI